MKNPLHEIFIPEAEENILILEDRIIGIENSPEDKNLLNEAFRAIHSIKGGAGLAGFIVIKNFTHIVEDLFESMRSGSIRIDKKLIGILLETLDILKLMISNISEDKAADDHVELEEVKEKILNIMKSESPDAKGMNYYFLDLQYYPQIWQSGVDPGMFLKDLSRMGEILHLYLDHSSFPPLDEFNPEEFYLRWQCFFKSEKNEKELNEIFCFIIDESNINIIDLSSSLHDPEVLKTYSIQGKVLSDFVQLAPKKEINSDQKVAYRRSSDLLASSYIRVQTEKLERIFNTVSELIISEAHLSLLSEQYEEDIPEEFSIVSDTIKDITRVLQEQVTSLRMMSLRSTFDRFKRLVRDLSGDMGKNITLELEGQDTELDKNMIEKLNDPLKHIVRNSIDHGIETREERIQKGKNGDGHLCLSAYIEDGKVIIEIKDDGRGIDKNKLLEKAVKKGLVKNPEEMSETDILNLIFQPGLSTASKVTDLSGRGVGMDVVKNAIVDLNGNISISSQEDVGTTIKLHLPLTLAILDGMLVDIGHDKYIVPTLSILEIFRPEREHLKSISAKGEVVFFRGEYIPMIRISRIFDIEDAREDPCGGELIAIQSLGMKAALLVDSVLEQFQVVLKSLQKNFKKIPNISSATIQGNGDVALILDIQNIVQNYAMRNHV